MGLGVIRGVVVTRLKKIPHPKGAVYHGMKSTDEGFSGFGEAYFSTVVPGETKGWKRHSRMTLNLIVPVGEIQCVLCDDQGRECTFQEIRLSQSSYVRVTVPPGIWVAFRGMGNGPNWMLNIASIQHDPSEAEDVPLGQFPYDWDRR